MMLTVEENIDILATTICQLIGELQKEIKYLKYEIYQLKGVIDELKYSINGKPEII